MFNVTFYRHHASDEASAIYSHLRGTFQDLNMRNAHLQWQHDIYISGYVIIATEPTSAATGDNSNRIPLIVGLCVGLGGGLLLILAVVLLAVFLHRRKVQREKEVTGTGGRTGNTTDARGRNSGIKQSTYLAWPEDDGDPNAQPVQLGN